MRERVRERVREQEARQEVEASRKQEAGKKQAGNKVTVRLRQREPKKIQKARHTLTPPTQS